MSVEAILRNDSPVTIPREISSRSFGVNAEGARIRVAGTIPPLADTTP
jgi:hypothetical protein